MFNLRFANATGELRMGHTHTPYKLTKVTGIDGIPVTLVTSQGFDQIGETLDSMSVESRSIGIIGRIDNFEPEQLRAVNNMFRPMTVVRMWPIWNGLAIFGEEKSMTIVFPFPSSLFP